MKVVNSFCVVILFAVSICWGQARSERSEKTSWEVFAPEGMGFRIEVPAKPHQNDNEYGDTDPKGYRLIRVYEPCESCLTNSAYQIIILVPSKAMHEEDKGRNKLAGLEFTIGGDDDAKPESESDITLNGLKGKEFIYHFPNADRLGHRKGRIIDARTRVFVLIYAADSASGLESSEAARFFSSFKVK